MKHLNFYSHEKVSERLILFSEGYSMVHRFTIGCIIGDEKIMIIDAGLGMTEEFRTYIESVAGTEKPVLIACTHGHIDHVGSACLFGERYCSSKDFGPDIVLSAFDPERRISDLEAFALGNKEVLSYCREHMLRDNETDFHDIEDGDIFDLGGIKIEAIAVPGHSKGSMAFFNRKEKYVFSGDAVNVDTHLPKLGIKGVGGYKKTLEHFADVVGDDATIYPAHMQRPITMNSVRNLITACGEIGAGKIEDDPPGETIFPSRQNNPGMRMHYVGNNCIIYNLEGI